MSFQYDTIKERLLVLTSCLYLSTILNDVEPELGVTTLNNIVDNIDQCGQQNIVQSCMFSSTLLGKRLGFMIGLLKKRYILVCNSFLRKPISMDYCLSLL